MITTPVTRLLVGLVVTKSRSRPFTSFESPYIERQFRILKYLPDFPKTFGFFRSQPLGGAPSSWPRCTAASTCATSNFIRGARRSLESGMLGMSPAFEHFSSAFANVPTGIDQMPAQVGAFRENRRYADLT